MKNTASTAAVGILVLTTCFQVAAMDVFDVIVKKDGTRIEGSIKSDDPDQIVIFDQNAEGVSVPVRAEELQYVFDREKGHKSWNSALNSFDYKDYRGAFSRFQKVIKNIDSELGKESAYQYAYLYAAECAGKLAAKGGKNVSKYMMASAQYYHMYINKFPRGRNIKQAVQGAVEGYLAADKLDKVKSLLPQLKRIDKDVASLLEARLALRKDDWETAIRAVTDLARGESGHRLDAQMILAQAYIGKGMLNQAREMAGSVVSNEASKDEYKAQAYMVLGDIHRSEAAQATDDKQKVKFFKDALLEYIRVQAEFQSIENTAAEALGKAIDICESLGKYGGEKKYRNRRKKLIETLLQRYPTSAAARKNAK